MVLSPDMYLVQVLLPVVDNEGRAFSPRDFTSVRRELTDHFGGATAYTRAPAQGTWEDEVGRVRHDDVVVIEVMVPALDREWWASYRAELARRFRQEELVVRASLIEPL
jgi:hypothetical protein